MTQPIISVRGLVNRFGKQIVHDRLDMTVYEKEIFGIVGGSGTGKSVLLRSILGLHTPAAGDIMVSGNHIRHMSKKQDHEMHKHWGVMYQQGALFSALSVIENIELPMIEYMQLPEHIIRELALLKLTMVGLPDEAAYKYPSELSGGMVKRAGLARALALDPPLLFLDEPTAGLDPIAADAFDHLILELRSQLGLTVVMITHDLDTLFDTCDRIGVLVEQTLFEGKPVEIMRNPNPWIQDYFGGQRARRALVPLAEVERMEHH